MIEIITTTTHIKDAAGNNAAGTVTLRPNASWRYDDGAGGLDQVDPKAVIITIAEGQVSNPSPLNLAPTENGGVTVTDAAYIVTYELTGTPTFSETWTLDADGPASIEWGAVTVRDSSFTVPGLPVQGAQGIQGTAGDSPDHFTRTSGTGAPGTTDTYTVWGDVGETINMGTFDVYNGADGAQGIQGIQGIQGDTGGQGIQGIQGIQGDAGDSPDHFTRTSGTGAPGTTDTYTVWGDVGETINMGSFDVYNGADGAGTGDMTKAVYDPNTKNTDAFHMDSMVEGTATKIMTDAERSKLSAIEAGADVTDAVKIASSVAGSTGKTTPVDADSIALIDSADLSTLKELTWSDIKAALFPPMSWSSPSFANSWASLGGANDAKYAQDSNNTVFLIGLVMSGSDSADTTIFTLPAGMRPSKDIQISALTNGGAGRLRIVASTGDVQFVGTSSHTGDANSFLSISTIFKGEQ